jgi:hypothetical protein
LRCRDHRQGRSRGSRTTDPIFEAKGDRSSRFQEGRPLLGRMIQWLGEFQGSNELQERPRNLRAKGEELQHGGLSPRTFFVWVVLDRLRGRFIGVRVRG